MKKKILTALLTLVMCFTVLISVAGCDQGSPATLNITIKTGSDFNKIEIMEDPNNFKAIQEKRLEELKKIEEITYDNGLTGDDHYADEWKSVEGGKSAYELFADDGGIVTNFIVTQEGERTMILKFRDGEASITYNVVPKA